MIIALLVFKGWFFNRKIRLILIQWTRDFSWFIANGYDFFWSISWNTSKPPVSRQNIEDLKHDRSCLWDARLVKTPFATFITYPYTYHVMAIKTHCPCIFVTKTCACLPRYFVVICKDLPGFFFSWRERSDMAFIRWSMVNGENAKAVLLFTGIFCLRICTSLNGSAMPL